MSFPEANILLAHRALWPVLVLLHVVPQVLAEAVLVVDVRRMARQGDDDVVLFEFFEAEYAFWIVLHYAVELRAAGFSLAASCRL